MKLVLQVNLGKITKDSFEVFQHKYIASVLCHFYLKKQESEWFILSLFQPENEGKMKLGFAVGPAEFSPCCLLLKGRIVLNISNCHALVSRHVVQRTGCQQKCCCEHSIMHLAYLFKDIFQLKWSNLGGSVHILHTTAVLEYVSCTNKVRHVWEATAHPKQIMVLGLQEENEPCMMEM